MSGGEQQRTALARVLAQQPQIVFADEPTGALDSRSGELVMTRLGEIAREPGRSVVVVTHDPGVAARCDRVIFLFDGRLAGELRPQSVAQVADVLTQKSTTHLADSAAVRLPVASLYDTSGKTHQSYGMAYMARMLAPKLLARCHPGLAASRQSRESV